ncbi:LLM class flavin-dependent oxidoreductase [Salipiger marinus]|uniref:FMN-dependent oxidoreductase, nitrilotriacetate monooxygenase family n=1 Tax=Salipiger marinus TaxID=555512 RepID=A0A1G8KSR1_9RHOB|nr:MULTISPECIES: LLM class flavin-dependent oxidoreductase [Salipiger]HBM60671.1 FMN-dependent monooxygenase [Citreicella sp.]MCD1618000.1 LLM class flavin-dependent oxidoreductase [Salipiger manganoxidans]MEB3418676.1 LLM class flavin-dependent oxidoreductase [Salipiger manganoxidans]SDI46417.1 FMN-dependent oxidoreductase, nitrilotriacetate monooxygenase family [Salipiger marinus]HBS99765.1 FMN-dependent monooxygenase [Citreicella sp.]
MTNPPRRMKIGINMVQNGAHNSGWRHPDADAGIANDFKGYARIIKAAEEQKIDFMFLADGAAVRIPHKDAEELSRHGHIDRFEPLTLLAAVAAVTDRIGLICTASTTYNEPYALARKFASLDHISDGRAGWNVVTGWSEEEALNFSRDALMDHSERYERANEFFDVVTGLWDSWDDDAFVRDKAEGRYFRPEGMHLLNHKGPHYQVRGPLNLARSPQGHPVIAQAGGSGPGRDLGARIADIIYTGQKDKGIAQEFYADMKARVAAAGRDPDKVMIMPGIMPIIGTTEAEAQAKLDEMKSLVHPAVGLQLISKMFGDLSDRDPEELMPLPLPESNGVKSAIVQWERRLERTPMTIRQVYEEISISSGHNVCCGTPAQIADLMQDWFEDGACDGWNLMAPYMPGGAEDFLTLLMPELRRRGLAQTDYAGDTLRSRLGLELRPNLRSGDAQSASDEAIAVSH